MPVLPNAKHEMFAQHVAKGKSADEAYKLAGYKPNHGNAGALKSKQYIIKRVAEILERAAVRTEITIQSLTEMYLEDRRLAHAEKQISAAKGAADSLAKLHGYMIDRREVGGPGDFSTMGDDELDRFIAERAREFGEGSAREALAPLPKGAGGRRGLN